MDHGDYPGGYDMKPEKPCWADIQTKAKTLRRSSMRTVSVDDDCFIMYSLEEILYFLFGEHGYPVWTVEHCTGYPCTNGLKRGEWLISTVSHPFPVGFIYNLDGI